MPYTIGVTAAISIGLVTLKAWRLPTFPHFNVVVMVAVAAVMTAVLLALLFGRHPINVPGWLEKNAITSWVIGLQIGAMLLVVPVLLLIKPVPEDDIPAWTWNFGYINKRWLIGLYNVSIATFIVCPVAVERCRLWHVDRRAAIHHQSPQQSRLRRIGGVVVIVMLAWYFTGPPWHLERHHRSIDWHEQMHLGGLQAISKGYLPYIGPASSSYGPGSQILVYSAMKLAGPFDIVSFRTAWAVVEFATMLAWGLAAYWWLGLGGAVAGMFLAMTYSPLSFFYTASDGTFGGYFGWANPLRYFPTLVTVVGFGLLAIDESRSRRSQSIGAVVLGILWAAGAWLAQENLSATAAAALLLAALLGLSTTAPVSRLLRLACFTLVGFMCVAVPILIVYGHYGLLGAFVRNYFLMPHAVAIGYSNLWWPPQDPVHPSYYFTLPLLIGLAICTLWQVPALRLVVPLDRSRTKFMALICVQLACYQTALFRSDAAHLMNTMIAMPLLLVLGVTELPRWLSPAPTGRIAAGLVVAVLVVVSFPATRSLQHYRDLLLTPARRFESAAQAGAPLNAENRVAFRRVTAFLVDEPVLASGSHLSTRQFLEFASDLHDLVGSRKTYVAWLGWRAWTGLVYFMADLTPAPYPLDRETMAINGPLRQMVADHIRAHPHEYECFIGISLTEPEALAFLQTHPGAQTFERVLPHDGPGSPTTVYVVRSAPVEGGRSVQWR